VAPHPAPHSGPGGSRRGVSKAHPGRNQQRLSRGNTGTRLAMVCAQKGDPPLAAG
jgi:hypothetical protein